MNAEASGHATLVAIRNAFKLGASLLCTWGIALAVRLFLPRLLGPARFGELNFADAFTTTFFVALTLGADVYIRKEVSVRTEHASDFFGGVTVLRLFGTAVIFALMGVVLHLAGRSPEVCRLVYVYGAAQLFVAYNSSLSALLHAKGAVDGMSVLAVATKVVWGVGILLALRWGSGLLGIGLAYLASESVETGVLYYLAREHLGLRFRIDYGHTKKMLWLSLPFYINTFAHSAYARLDVTILAMKASDREVGWYGAASGLAGLSMMVTPLIGWVLVPLFARAVARSQGELFDNVRRSLELILTVAIPASLFLAIGGDFFMGIIFGPAFVPGIMALRILAMMYIITYVAIVCASALTLLDRGWTLTVISLGGLVVNPVLNLLFIGPALRRWGDGGGGVGCALAMLGTEIFVTSAMLVFVGKGAFDRQNLITLGKTLAVCLVVVCLDRALASWGYLRLIPDAITYVVLIIAVGALRVREITGLVALAMKRRRGSAETA